MKNLLLFLFVSLVFNLFAQRQEDAEFNKINEEISKEMETYNKKIEAVFKKENPDLFKQMQERASQINKIKDETEMDKAIEEFEKKYLKQYTYFAKKAGVDLKSFANKLKKKYSNYKFEVEGFAIHVENNSNPTGAVRKSNPSSTTQRIEIKDFKQVVDEDCDDHASQEFESNSAKVISETYLKGTCRSYACLKSSYQIPADAKQVTVDISYRYKFRVQAFSAGSAKASVHGVIGFDCMSNLSRDGLLVSNICNDYLNPNISYSVTTSFGVKKRNRRIEYSFDASHYKGRKIEFFYAAQSQNDIEIGGGYSRSIAVIESIKITVEY